MIEVRYRYSTLDKTHQYFIDNNDGRDLWDLWMWYGIGSVLYKLEGKRHKGFSLYPFVCWMKGTTRVAFRKAPQTQNAIIVGKYMGEKILKHYRKKRGMQ